MKSENTSRPGNLAPPMFATAPAYGARLGDAAFWAPYVAEALARHGLPVEAPHAGAVGSFPTFLAGRYVVKFFGELFAGAVCYEVERSLHRLFLTHPDIPAPALVADGRLFNDADGGWAWPYLITTRLTGTAWCNAVLQPAEQEELARDLGRAVRCVHELPPPAGPVWERDWPAELLLGCVERHRRWGTLPSRLVGQIEGFLVEPLPVRRLVHADLHEDHLFVERGRLAGIIDWGDALLIDPYYELPALHLGTFGRDKRLLRAFLEGYAWKIGADFARRAMSMTLVHEYDVLRAVTRSIDLHAVRTLDELAVLLWELPERG